MQDSEAIESFSPPTAGKGKARLNTLNQAIKVKPYFTYSTH